jgi:hypothetical protein
VALSVKMGLHVKIIRSMRGLAEFILKKKINNTS